MQSLTVLMFVLIAKLYLAHSIIETSKGEGLSQLAQAMVKVLTSCYGNQLDTVGLAGNSDVLFIKALQSSTSVPVTLLDSTRRFVSHVTVERENRYMLQVFVITTSSSTQLKKIFKVMKNSLWWNHKAFIFILAELRMSEDGCSKAFEMLSAAWKMNLLNTKLMYLHPTKKILVYDYNPYTRRAPDYWEVENTYNEENGHPWTLLKRTYEENKQNCEELDFDKTLDLGGYEIRSSVKIHPGIISVEFNQSTEQHLGGCEGILSNIMFRAMNAIPKLLIYNRTNHISFLDGNGRDILMDTVDGFSDILLNHRYVTVKKGVTVAYPYFNGGLGILTKPSSQISILSQILNVVDTWSQRGICLVILITLLYFIFFLKQSLVPAMLNTLRLICNGSLLSTPTNLAPRFYLGSLFIFVVTVQALYQGNLATFLTKPTFLPNVNSLQDLVDRKYTMYAYKTLEPYYNSKVFEGRYVKLEKFSCTEYVIHDPRAACSLPFEWLIEDAIKFRLYLSDDNIYNTPVTLVIRDDWPLESRLNKIRAKMFEAYIINIEFGEPYQKMLDIHAFYEKHGNDEQFQSITLNALSFAFVLLGIGLSCATVCFIAEMGTKLHKFLIKVTVCERFKIN